MTEIIAALLVDVASGCAVDLKGVQKALLYNIYK